MMRYKLQSGCAGAYVDWSDMEEADRIKLFGLQERRLTRASPSSKTQRLNYMLKVLVKRFILCIETSLMNRKKLLDGSIC